MIRVDPPPSPILWTAVTIYLDHAYGDVIPPHIARQIEDLRRAAASDLYACACFERDDPAAPSRYSLRLGNRHYPHMKLVVEHLSARGRWFFRVDTHDLHVHLDPSNPEFEDLQRLHARNAETAAAIEAAWAAAGVETFRAFLHRDLDARRG